MKKCVVIGGGAAGLSSAVYLSKSGFQVELIEASQKLGGRAYSFLDKDSNTIIDNGQHILLGACRETIKFLDIIGAKENIHYQKKLRVNFLKKDFKIFPLEANHLPYPFNLASALLNYKALSIKDRFLLLKFFLKIYFYSDSELKKLSVYEWLIKENQNKNILKSFWEILVIGIMNTNPEKASAKMFSDILKEIFFRGNFAAAILLPKDGLTEFYCDNARDFIEKSNGNISLSEQVEKIIIESGKAVKIKTSKRVIENFDYIVSALPHFALKKIISFSNNFNDINFKYSTILSIHLWLKENTLEKTFYGLIDSPVHWIFNKGSHLTIVISDANKYSDMEKEDIFKFVSEEIETYTKIKKDDIISYKIIKEKRATFIPSNDIIDKRPSAKTNIKNLFLAGDWINTGLPSTIESAVKSGRIAAEEIIKQLEVN